MSPPSQKGSGTGRPTDPVDEPTQRFPVTPARTTGASGAHDGEATPPGPDEGQEGSAEAPERSIGPFRLLDVLGEGGMGTVYLAEQTQPIQRRVAVKLMRSTRPDLASLRRFEAERQTLARMQHPNIAQVFAAGATQAGEPYIVMELVPGTPITRYCEERRLGLRARLELFLMVCEGVQHAHQKGVLHRDIKPSNVLVMEEQGRPLPKLIDFGIAKDLEPPPGADTTRTLERIVGTPGYLSPEAIRAPESGLDVDTRSDVYSLGVLLYELLTGVAPFPGDIGLLELIRRIGEEEPTPPSRRFADLAPDRQRELAAERATAPGALRRKLRGDLDWITLQALAKRRRDRYASAAALADDVRRHLGGQPVEAGPPSRIYRARKLVQRHKPTVAAAVLGGLALVGGFWARTLEAERANREAERASLQAAAARRAEAEADAVAAFLIDLFEVSDPTSGRGITITARELLDEGATRVREELVDHPLRRARLLTTIGTVYRKLGLYAEAGPLLDEALALRERELGPDHLETAASLEEIVTLDWQRGRYLEGEPLARRALAIRRAALPPGHPDVARSLNDLAALLRRSGRADEAMALYEEAIEIRRQAHGPRHPALAASLNDLAILRWNRGDYDPAAALLREAAAIYQQNLGPDHLEVAATLSNLAGVYRDQGRYDEAEPLYRQTLAIRRRTLDADHPSLGYSLANLASLLREQGRHAEAAPLYEEALGIWESRLGPDHPEVAFVLSNRALLHLETGEPEEALPLAERALAINRAALGGAHPSTGSALNIQALIRAALGQSREAERLHRAALAVYEAVDPRHPRVAWALHGLGSLLQEEGRGDEARPLLERALDIRTERLGPEHPDTRETRESLAEPGSA